jgi:excinuclease ABC subunit C
MLKADCFNRKDFSRLPETTGLFCLFDSDARALFAGAAENLKKEIFENQFFGQASSAEIRETKENLPRELSRLIRQTSPRFNFQINEQTLYPHLKITAEKFPRLLVTRRILNDTDEYFGAFLPRTGVRIWLYVLSRLFRLRSCELDIRGGDLSVPCVMFREKRCLAPCVDGGPEKYAESVDLLRLFLAGKKTELLEILKAKIENSAADLEFENASEWRDLLNSARNIFADPRMDLWLGDAVDTYFIERDRENIFVHIITTRARRTLGFHIFVFPGALSDSFALGEILWQFYQFYAPKEIRLTKDLKGRKFFAASLSRQAGRDVRVSRVSEERSKTAFRSLKRSKRDLKLKRLSNLKTVEEIQIDLQRIFSLAGKPARIEAFDVAHISGEDFVGACAVWKDGKVRAENSGFWLLDSTNEPQAMAEAVHRRLNESEERPDLILLDGGQSQIKAVRKILADEDVPLIGAVKPGKRHAEISYFLTEGGARIEFESNPVFEILRNLRDEAHASANEIHRQRREIGLLSKQEGRETLLVPIRFDEPNGAAEDFPPISTVRF